jgi:ZIP family zinc transporter
MHIIWIGLLGSALAGGATGIGALPSFIPFRVTDRLLDTLLGFAAGVMLAASCFCLLVPAIARGGIWTTSAGMTAGILFILLADRSLPHLHFISGHEGPAVSLKRIWLFVLAITIHNFPEGLAVGVGFGGGDIHAGTVIATAIGLQNIPEGLAVAIPLLREGYSGRKAFVYATLTGLVEPVGGLIGVASVSIAGEFLSVGMGFAAGAMLFVISDEILPETHRKGHERWATVGVMIGFIVMMILDTIFG